MPFATDAAHVGGSEGQLHLVGVGIEHAIEDLDQTAGLLHRVVVVVVGVLDVDVVHHDIKAALPGAGVVEEAGFLDLPGVDALMEDRRDDVNVTVHYDGFVVQFGCVDGLSRPTRRQNRTAEKHGSGDADVSSKLAHRDLPWEAFTETLPEPDSRQIPWGQWPPL